MKRLCMLLALVCVLSACAPQGEPSVTTTTTVATTTTEMTTSTTETVTTENTLELIDGRWLFDDFCMWY